MKRFLNWLFRQTPQGVINHTRVQVVSFHFVADLLILIIYLCHNFQRRQTLEADKRGYYFASEKCNIEGVKLFQIFVKFLINNLSAVERLKNNYK